MAIQKGNGSSGPKFDGKGAIPQPKNTVTPSQIEAGIAPPKERPVYQRVCFDLDKAKYHRLKVILAQENRTVADLFRELIDERYPNLLD